MKNKKPTPMLIAIFIMIIVAIFPGMGNTATNKILSHGQLVYVPVYSHIYHGNRERQFNLTITLSIRNTNLEKDIILHSIDYFDSNGKLLKSYLESPSILKKFASIRYVINAADDGGSGAKFIVRWKSKELVNAPLIEAIMISTQSQQGISFVSRGQAIME